MKPDVQLAVFLCCCKSAMWAGGCQKLLQGLYFSEDSDQCAHRCSLIRAWWVISGSKSISELQPSLWKYCLVCQWSNSLLLTQTFLFILHALAYKTCCFLRKPFLLVRPVKAHISLCLCSVWSEPAWGFCVPLAFQRGIVDCSCHIRQTDRLIYIFTGLRTSFACNAPLSRE